MHAANMTPIRDARGFVLHIYAVPVNATAITDLITDQHTSRAYHSRSGPLGPELYIRQMTDRHVPCARVIYLWLNATAFRTIPRANSTVTRTTARRQA
jgi:hypothetical protein